jgi:FkbM family methyltransferase
MRSSAMPRSGAATDSASTRSSTLTISEDERRDSAGVIAPRATAVKAPLSWKSRLKIGLQRGMGFHRYLVVHSVFVALTMRLRKNEGAVLQFISRLAPDANVLDVGANVGTMSLLFAQKCPRGKVFAFEPIPENYHAARTVLNMFRVKNARLFQLGIGERNESVTMVMPSAGPNVRLEGLSHVVDPAHASTETGTFYTVPLVALDSFAELRDVPISAIKIDVEDHERFVIRGARDLICRNRPLIYCELWGDENKVECFAMLGELNYECFIAANETLEPYDSARHGQINFFFVPRERRADYAIAKA